MTFDEMLAGESAATVRLAESVSLAVLIEPALLRRARLELERHADPGVEADVWFSSFVASRDPDGIVFKREAAEGLRQRLAASIDRRRSSWALLQQLHAGTSPALQLEEEIAWLLVDEAAQALPKIKQRLRSAIATLVGGERIGLAHWAVQAISRLPDAVLALDETRILYTAARLRLGESSADADVPDWMSWVLPTSHSAQAAIRLRIMSGVLELERAAPEATTTGEIIRVPSVEPLTIEVDGGDGFAPLTVQAAGPTFARIGSDAVRLRASDGAIYELTPSKDLERRRQREIVRFDSLFAEHEGLSPLREPLEAVAAASLRVGVGVLVTGPPGIGKTGLLIAFTRTLSRAFAAHFFSDRAYQWRDADLAWTSLAALVERVSAVDAAAPSRPVDRLRRALHRLLPREDAFVLILDGLDELGPSGRAIEDLEALFGGGLPPHACVIASCDSDSPIAGRLRALFESASSMVELDVDHERWWHARIDAAQRVGIDQGTAQRLDGNLLAAHLVLTSPIQEAEAPQRRSATTDVIASAWGRLSPAARSVLSFAAAAREPLTRPRIEEAVAISGPLADAAFETMGPWLAVGRTPDAENAFALRHAVLRAFVQQAGSVNGGASPVSASHAALLRTVAKWTPRDLGEFQKEVLAPLRRDPRHRRRRWRPAGEARHRSRLPGGAVPAGIAGAARGRTADGRRGPRSVRRGQGRRGCARRLLPTAAAGSARGPIRRRCRPATAWRGQRPSSVVPAAPCPRGTAAGLQGASRRRARVRRVRRRPDRVLVG